MAILKLHQPIDMNTLQAWDGQFPIVNAGQIRATDGVRTQDYFGNFQFDADGLTGGTLTSTVAYQNGLYYEITGLNIDAMVMEGYIGDFDFNGALNEVLKGDDTLIGSAGNDLLKGGSGNDSYDGGSGIDTVYYGGAKGSAAVNASGNGYTVATPGKVDTLINVERVGMGDGSILALDVKAGEHAGSAYRLYQAAFDRKPDAAGLNYWTHDLDAGNNIQQVAKGFVDSAEFKALNPANDQNSVINNFYLHVLHRDADTAGLQYWNAEMSSGMTASQVLVSFSESQENIGNVAVEVSGGVWLS
ncbi:MAG TPA: DUF4214 domain-containing protein [Pseudomonas sp.]|jgi:Ca2+-binding RTX toxin-like protein|uniref:DUF4214 domain-containing protein n=1 Tax=Pseudomonas sp. TaxID=306 RepID=UPI002ED8B889